MATLVFDITADNRNFKQKLDEVERSVKTASAAIKKDSRGLELVFQRLTTAAGSGAGSNLRQQFERLGRLGQEAFGEMSVKAQQLVKDIQEDTVSLSSLEKMQRALNDQYEAGKIPLDDYISAQARLAVIRENISNAIRTNEQALRSESATMGQAEDSMASMQRQIALLTTSYMNLSQAQREGTEGQQILKNLSDVQTRLQNASAAMSKYGGAANKQFNGLNFSIQQIARELPTLAMGPQMFFMAISNNLPMFTDELARARKEYAAMEAEGKKGVPVWKQVAKSLFSWQTALVGGITLLTIYGDEIISWVGAVLKGREAVISTTKALKDMQKAADFDNAGQQIANFERIASLYREIGDNAEEKKKFLEQYEEEIKKTGLSISDVNDADNVFIGNTDAFIESIEKRALSLAGQQLAQEQYSKALKQRMKDEKQLAEAEAELERLRELPSDFTVTTVGMGSGSAGGQGAIVTQTRDELIAAEEKLIERIKARSQAYFDAGNSYIKVSNDMERAADEALDKAGIDTTDKAEIAKNNAERARLINEQRLQIEALMDKNSKVQIQKEIDIQHQIDQAKIDAMKDGYNKEVAQMELDHKKELEAIEKQKEDYKQAVIDGEREVFEAQEALRSQQDEDYVKKIFDPASVQVDTSVFDNYIKELKSETVKRQLKEEESLLLALIQEYETYEQAKLRIQEEYAEKRRVLMNEDGSMREGVMQGNLDELARQEQEAIESISVTFAMRDAAFEQWSKNLSYKTAEALDLMLSEAMEQLSILENTEGVDPKAIADATAKIVKLREALDTAEYSASKTGSEWEDLNTVLKDSFDIFNDLADSIPGTAGKIVSALGRIGASLVSVSNSFNAMKDAKKDMESLQESLAFERNKAVPDEDRIKKLSDALKSLKSESLAAGMSVASGVASIVSSVISGITEIINTNKEANRAAADAAWEYARAIEAAQETARLDRYDTIFGENALGRYRELKELIDETKASLNDVMEGFVLGPVGNGLDSIMASLKKLTSGQIITADMRSWWQRTFGSDKNVETFDLADYINEDGTVKMTELQALYDQYAEYMSDSDRHLVDTILENGEKLNSYLEEERQYISSLFGDLAGNVADVMIDAFERTGDAANASFDDIRQQIARTFARNAIIDMLLGEDGLLGDDVQKEFIALMRAGDTEGALDLLNGTMEGLSEVLDDANAVLKGTYGEYAGSAAEEQDRTSTSKGVAQASQDSVDELNGRATVIQGHTYSISTDMKVLVSTSAMMLDRLAAIETNTARLEGIESGIAQIRSDISYINTKGLFLRK